MQASNALLKKQRKKEQTDTHTHTQKSEDETVDINIRLHSAEWCDEEEEACTSLFSNGLLSALLDRGCGGAQRMKFRPQQ